MFFMAFSGSSSGLSFAFCLEIAGPILCSLAVLQPKSFPCAGFFASLSPLSHFVHMEPVFLGERT